MAEFKDVVRQFMRMMKTKANAPRPYFKIFAQSDGVKFVHYGVDENDVYGTVNVLNVESFEKMVTKWAEAHPEKTMMDVLLEKFPNVQRKTDEAPIVCPYHLGLCESNLCPTNNCLDCWNRPAPENDF